jgi:hypothetical protein
MIVYVKNNLATTKCKSIEEKFIPPLGQGFQPYRIEFVFGLFNAIDRLIV